MEQDSVCLCGKLHLLKQKHAFQSCQQLNNVHCLLDISKYDYILNKLFISNIRIILSYNSYMFTHTNPNAL